MNKEKSEIWKILIYSLKYLWDIQIHSFDNSCFKVKPEAVVINSLESAKPISIATHIRLS